MAHEVASPIVSGARTTQRQPVSTVNTARFHQHWSRVFALVLVLETRKTEDDDEDEGEQVNPSMISKRRVRLRFVDFHFRCPKPHGAVLCAMTICEKGP